MLESLMSLEEKLVALVAALDGDGGNRVVRTLQPMLAEIAPFDAGEVDLAGPIGHHRWTLTSDETAIASEDLLLRLEGDPLRIDDRAEASAFPRTHVRMAESGFRSLLAVPFGSAGGPRGAIVLAHRDGWAFAAASLRLLRPLAQMTGLCLQAASSLTSLRREVEMLRVRSGRADG
jgi:hypothetical protein